MAKSSQSSPTAHCYHCGDRCGEPPVRLEEKVFCCEGCKMVYQILNENELVAYYEMEAHPGTSLKERGDNKKFAYLDNPEIASRLIEFEDEDQIRISFFLPQIHCSSCIWLLENIHRLRPAIFSGKVNFLRKEVNLAFSKKEISLREVVELLASIGYEPEINLQDLSKPSGKKYNRRLFFQLGVAGFCFGNIMLLSFPEYLSLGSYIEEEFTHFLAISISFYPCRSCYTALRIILNPPGTACGREASISMCPFPSVFWCSSVAQHLRF